MKYLLLAYTGPPQEASSSGEHDAFDEALREEGYLLAALRLPGDSATATLRLQGGRLSLTDGPLIETKERLVALFCIDARDLNEAIRVAARLPQARHGPIEVRSLVEFDWPSQA